MRPKYPELRLRMPARLIDAIERAARRQFSTASVYSRQALVAKLAADGALPAELDEPRAAEPRERATA